MKQCNTCTEHTIHQWDGLYTNCYEFIETTKTIEKLADWLSIGLCHKSNRDNLGYFMKRCTCAWWLKVIGLPIVGLGYIRHMHGKYRWTTINTKVKINLIYFLLQWILPVVNISLKTVWTLDCMLKFPDKHLNVRLYTFETAIQITGAVPRSRLLAFQCTFGMCPIRT